MTQSTNDDTRPATDGRQPPRSFRCPDHIWVAAGNEANNRGESLSAAINRLLATYAGVDMPPRQWFVIDTEVVQFARILAAADALTSADEAIYFIEKPHKWDDEHEQWVRLGRPRPAEDAQPASETWPKFVELIEGR